MKGNTKCSCGCGLDMQEKMKDLLSKLETKMQEIFGRSYELTLTCGARCEARNAMVGGAKNSAHLLGLAADIAAITSVERYNLLRLSFSFGIRRIEDRLLNHHYIHIDIATGDVPNPTDKIKQYPQDVFIVVP